MAVRTPPDEAQLRFADLALPDARPEGDSPLRDTTFVVVDLETTGGRARPGPAGDCDAITEIGAVKVRGGEVIGEFATLVDPGCAIPPKIVELTGITTAMVRRAPRFEELARQIADFSEGRVFVAHSVNFDYPIVRDEFARCGVAFQRKKLCTVRLSRKVFPGLRSYSLQLLARELATLRRYPSSRGAGRAPWRAREGRRDGGGGR